MILHSTCRTKFSAWSDNIHLVPCFFFFFVLGAFFNLQVPYQLEGHCRVEGDELEKHNGETSVEGKEAAENSPRLPGDPAGV